MFAVKRLSCYYYILKTAQCGTVVYFLCNAVPTNNNSVGQLLMSLRSRLLGVYLIFFKICLVLHYPPT